MDAYYRHIQRLIVLAALCSCWLQLGDSSLGGSLGERGETSLGKAGALMPSAFFPERVQAVLVRNEMVRSLQSVGVRRDSLWQAGLKAFEGLHFDAASVFFEAFIVESTSSEDRSRGHYWLARAEESLGHHSVAKEHLRESMKQARWGYYGALSKERLGAFPFSDSKSCEVKNAYLEEAPRSQLVLAAYGKWKRFFPRKYVGLISSEARRNSLDPSWLVALARQESGFDSQAVSQAGAIGLLQVMPETGNSTLKRRAEEMPQTAVELLDPEFNISVGVVYFRKLVARFNGDEMLALAAYNAGPTALTRWLSRWGEVDADLWVEKIPYKETQNYVKRVKQWRARYLDYRDAQMALTKKSETRPVFLASTD